MLWNSWAKSWGSAWAESWGPLEEQEQGQVPHGGGSSSAARIAREAIEEARRKAARKRREGYAREAQEALDELRLLQAQEAAQEAIRAARSLPVEGRAGQPDSIDPDATQPVTLSPLPPVNNLLINAQISSVDRFPAVGKTIKTESDDDEAMALIMILAELE